MDTNARRRALRKQIQADLSRAYTEEEASPPEWVDLLMDVRSAVRALEHAVKLETEAFVREPDIKAALLRRARVSDEIRKRASKTNGKIRRLNLIAPSARFTRRPIDTDALLRPLYRSPRHGVSGSSSG